jgi:hypothetical protein
LSLVVVVVVVVDRDVDNDDEVVGGIVDLASFLNIIFFAILRSLSSISL